MGVPAHNLDALEQRRLTLEDNILKLQKSLYHWRTWEAEYDGLRDEIKDLPSSATSEDLFAVGQDLGGSLVTEEELQTIIGTRSRGQVVDLLGRRIDYVKQNVATMEKRLRAAEDELSGLDESESVPTEGGADFPMREIMEELDEDGEVIASSVNAPGDQAPQLLEVLKKVGVENIPEKAGASEGSSKDSSATVEKSSNAPNTETTKPQQNGISNIHTTVPETNGSQEDELDLSKPVSIVTEQDRQQLSTTDIDESEEDARLRREMIEYGINEVGAIVAELELDEDASDVSYEEDYTWATDEEDEEEDEFGRTRTELTDDYHEQMRELESKLNARGMWNMGKDTQTFPSEVQQEIQEPAPANDVPVEEIADSSSKGKKPKKRVAFADDLDIAPAPKAPQIQQIPDTERRTLPPKPEPSPLSDAIIERTDRVQDSKLTASAPPKKASRFKSARSTPSSAETDTPAKAALDVVPTVADTRAAQTQVNATHPTTSLPLFPAKSQEPKPFSAPISDSIEETYTGPRPPEGKTLANKLVEREIAPGAAKAPETEEVDEEMHRREIASEFYRMRNHMIQNNGGFLNEEEQAMIPIETDEPPKRVSKFKSARMR
ncbi:hypothetical protein N7478_010371 [Penicillium angulare]|uniref:uncharacterized protein n=1 Tax=Penicillium angulare TaxID=116970 RepID=UPI00253FEC5B|nr:uncharacterized protein N7478_010371 [Penicillium angulare]KAJ5267563.1 hypothetical protein N7478_010371 [Penicillium angulare]